MWCMAELLVSCRIACRWITLNTVKLVERINSKLEALRQCIPPPRYVLPLPPSGESVRMNVRKPLSISPNSDEPGKQSLYPDGDPDRHQNLIACSLVHCQPFLKISCKSVWKFLRKVANRQTDKQTRRLHILLGGGNYRSSFWFCQ